MVITTVEMDEENCVVMHRRRNPRYTTRYAVPSGTCHVRGSESDEWNMTVGDNW